MKPGRKPKLTEELIKEVEKYISNGMSDIDTCAMLNISRTTYYAWKNEGEADAELGKENLKVKFFNTIKKSESKFKLYHMQQITSAGNKDWTASAWLLERKFPEEFGRVDRNKISADENSNVKIEIVNDVPNKQ